MKFSKFSPEEVERRRALSVAALKALRAEKFAREYQERCDKFYWSHGECCAGCDHWSSYAGDTGECLLAPPISGHQVLLSLNIQSSSYIPAPGQPYTRRDHVCGSFSDEFDWPSLGREYLARIGAPLSITKEPTV